MCHVFLGALLADGQGFGKQILFPDRSQLAVGIWRARSAISWQGDVIGFGKQTGTRSGKRRRVKEAGSQRPLSRVGYSIDIVDNNKESEV